MKEIILLIITSVSLNATAQTEKETGSFFHETYNYAKLSEQLNTAAMCELTSKRLKIPNSNKFYINAVVELSMKSEYPSHELLEYELAYDSVKNFHHGRFITIDDYNKENQISGYKYLYKELKCELLLK
ncbi:hypothetical protein [Thalassolituus pacificus]|uniref:Uncharacterized protein n=1 Tax=Thalassolituus pacificus TaxID=2975440 RepID=A0A9X2WFU6_9GAMM|nr:hypothetical protein [Thalassolituus pacificus]MCT7359468.1 hypothetical protein [Thalassolituus pacificus]